MHRVIVVTGAPAAGKSRYAQSLAHAAGATLLDIDTVTGRLIETALKASGHDVNDRDSSYFKQTYRDAIYQSLFDIARENLAWTSVIIVGPFTREIRQSNWPEELAQLLSAPVEIHYVYCNPKERQRRLIERNLARDHSKLADWENFLKYYGNEDPPQFKHVFIDTTSKNL